VTTGAVERGAEHRDSGGERWYLNDEREFLLRSIDDAAREHDAGDLSDADYGVLMGRDRSRLAEVEAELAALGPEATDEAVQTSPDAPPRRRYGRGAASGSSSPVCSS